ncbi:5-formyltetrahydrofolate cyclo-ligase [Thiothrix subterranea]|uniref:5-formyltetrahydrofolate cyclo-ligase n=1 Tax=Thiothrix subterranea TaxID=2735563 RepID=UPI00192B6067|nr:5-formyltetrahydrofolate cyclo-ligase [Thiothrix subterranea]
MPATSPPPANPSLRRTMQRQRAALPQALQAQLSQQAVQHLTKQRAFRNARHIALYLPVRGEADPRNVRQHALPQQRFYLPVLSPFKDGRLWFVRWDANTRFRLNRFRIPEPYPRYRDRRPAAWLDLVITPLVAFDHTGTRMGMGGGFYDRTFGFKRTRSTSKRPHLCGFAYSFQQINYLMRQSWDIPLDMVSSEQSFFHFGTGIY